MRGAQPRWSLRHRTTRLSSGPGYSTQAPGGRTPVVLGIETSCDDTAIAVVSGEREILYNASTSQWAKHWREYKGVNPALALREHETGARTDFHRDLILSALPLLLSEWRKKNPNLQPARDLSAVAVTSGPGLALALGVGVRIAREFAQLHELPLLGINHLAAHNLVARLKEPSLDFPFMSLLISGGHSQLLLCEGVNKFQLLGGTHDDSVGEAFDKVARLLNLDAANMAAGEALEINAAKAVTKIKFTVPLKGVKDCNFSFSGLKSQVAREIAKSNLNDPAVVSAIAAGFQDAAVAHLSDRTSLTVVGGVARNNVIRTRLAELCKTEGISLVVPPTELCSDNGVMIAWAGVEQFLAGIAKPQYDIKVQPRWQLDSTFNPRKPSR